MVIAQESIEETIRRHNQAIAESDLFCIIAGAMLFFVLLYFVIKAAIKSSKDKD